MKIKEESLRIAKETLNFEPASKQGEDWSKEYFLIFCNRLLNQKISVNDFCKKVNLFDLKFEVPLWLDNFYDHCDWCDERWTFENTPELKEAVETYIKNNITN